MRYRTGLNRCGSYKEKKGRLHQAAHCVDLSAGRRAGRQAIPVHSAAARYLAGAGSVAGRSPTNTARAGLRQRGLALLRSDLVVVGAIAVALPVLTAKLRGSKRTKPVVSARQDGAIAWISAGWNAFVLVRALQRNFGAGARSTASLPVQPSTPPPVSEKVGLVTASAAGEQRFNLKSVYVLLKASISNWIDDFAPSMGAALAYYTVFSIAPLLVIAIAVAALVFGQSAAQHEILDQIRGLLGSEGANAIESMLISAQKPKEGVLASALSIVMLLVGATTVFSELESDLNRIWRVPASKQSGIWSLLRARLLSLGLVVTIGFLLLVSLVANAALAAWGKYWSGWFFGVEVALQAANFLLSLVVFTLLFALMYKVLPRVPIAWRDVWVGAGVTSLLFAIGKAVPSSSRPLAGCGVAVFILTSDLTFGLIPSLGNAYGVPMRGRFCRKRSNNRANAVRVSAMVISAEIK